MVGAMLSSRSPAAPSLRTTNVARLQQGIHDVLVVGGGINGAVAAACLSARGARVAFVDRSDFASFTSQQSSNLAWGGIKYMESFEFALVRKLCMSRNHLIRSYPSTVREIRFYVMHEKGFRHGLWKLALGTWFYWLIGNFFTKKPRLLPMRTIAKEEPILELKGSDGGFEYSDAYLHDNDARFVWNFVRGALDHGCIAANYVEVSEAKRESDGLWHAVGRDSLTGETFPIRAKVLLNACGPFVDALNTKNGAKTDHKHVFSKGIHLIVNRLTPHQRVLTFFADDGRLFFVIPMGPRTCIGTTDTRVDDPQTAVTAEDRRFVLENINKRLKLDKPLTEADIIAERCGVRPLAVSTKGGASTDWMQMSRKHVVEVDEAKKQMSIFGGKLTDCLNVGEEVAAIVEKLGISLPFPKARWYGEPADDVRDSFFHQARLMDLDQRTSSTSSEPLSTRLWRRYGAQAFDLLEAIRADPTSADVLIEGAEYLRCEIELAARREMIVKLDDFLRRRSKIALVLRRDAIQNAPGLREACRLFFGSDAEAKIAEYFGDSATPLRNPSPSVGSESPSTFEAAS
jgi:glycerol-3-phosphate dehydrogenase